MKDVDVVIIGGGPAGLSAATECARQGIERIVIIERDKILGGILNQCIHNGFGLAIYKEELTGTEYAYRAYQEMATFSNIEIMLDTMVMEINPDRTLYCMNSKDGYIRIQAKAIILAMGCRERSRGAVAIPGTRPAGVYTAGAAQHYMNIDGYQVGKRVLIVGSGDIGLIMARRLVLEDVKVIGCVEIKSTPSGLPRNIEQCLNDYHIPLMLSTTVTAIHGDKRVSGVTISRVDENYRPIPGTEDEWACDTVLLSVGLIPENELSRRAGISMDLQSGGPLVSPSFETSIEGIFACGNVLHVHDLADNVTKEAVKTGKAAADYVKGLVPTSCNNVTSAAFIKPNVPYNPDSTKESDTYRYLTCIACPRGCTLKVTKNEPHVVEGNACPRGEKYAIEEMTAPKRTITSTMRVRFSDGTWKRISVKTKEEIPKSKIMDMMRLIHHTKVTGPVHIGDEVARNVIATSEAIQ